MYGRSLLSIMSMLWLGTPCNAQSVLGQAPQDEIVPLYAAGPRALAILTLGNGAPAPVVFDTGEDKAFLSTPYAKGLNLPVIGTSPFIDEARGSRSSVPLIRLAAAKLSGVAATLTDARIVDYTEHDVVGVVGPGMFPGRLVTLELAHNRLRVAPLSPDRVPRQSATPYFHDIPALNIDVAGISVLVHLDSGQDGGLSLSTDLMSKVKLKHPATLVGQARSVSGVQDIYAAQIDGDVKIGPLVLHDPEVNFMGTGGRGNAGYQILRQLTLVMDPAGQRSWVLDPTASPSPFADFAGQFGVRVIRVQGDQLIYQRQGRPSFALTYLGSDLFEMPGTGDRVQFYRRDGRVAALELITADGEIAVADRTS